MADISSHFQEAIEFIGELNIVSLLLWKTILRRLLVYEECIQWFMSGYQFFLFCYFYEGVDSFGLIY